MITSKTRISTIGNFLLQSLYDKGVEHIFGLPGDYILTFDKLIEMSPIQFVNTTRENTAGALADAYARVRGIGCAAITYGVGINIVQSIAQCNLENSPVVLISGASGKEERRACTNLHHSLAIDAKEERIQLEIFKKVTAAQALLNDPKRAEEEIERVLEIALKKKRPVYIELPRDVTLQEIELHRPEPVQKESPDPKILHEALEEVASLLRDAKHPFIWAGHEIGRFSLTEPLLRFARSFNLPIATTLQGKGVISERDPLSLGVYQGGVTKEPIRSYLEKSDFVLMLGMIYSDVDTGIMSAPFERGEHLLASRDRVEIKKHSFELDLKTFVRGLADLKLHLRFQGCPKDLRHRDGHFIYEKRKAITAERLFSCLQSHLPENAIVAADIGDALFGASELVVDEGNFLSNAYFAAMGWATPAAIGASFAKKQKRAVAIVGDGAFQMTGVELSTAVRYGLDPVVIVLNNHGFATERPLMEGSFNDIQSWNYYKLPELIGGGRGVRVETEGELERALVEAFSTRGEAWVIEVELNKEDKTSALKRFLDFVKGPRTR